MSKIGKQPILIPSGVIVQVTDGEVLLDGPKGKLQVEILPGIKVEENEGQILVQPKKQSNQTRAFWGLNRSLLANAVQGVLEGFEKQLEMVGVGYRVSKKGTGLELEVGFSHKVSFEPPADVTLEIEKGIIKVTGISKQKVGQVAAEIRAVRPPEPYKGKGIRYVGEVVMLKPGKAAKVGGSS